MIAIGLEDLRNGGLVLHVDFAVKNVDDCYVDQL
jgi:hypothetical protein